MPKPPETIIVAINLTPAQLHAYYAGGVSWMLVQSTDGRKVQLPIQFIRPFVTRQGVSGYYQLEVSAQGKLLSISPAHQSTI